MSNPAEHAEEEAFFDCVVMTPEKQVYKNKARSLLVEAESGMLEILPHHEACLAPLKIGAATLNPWDRRESKEIVFTIHGGFLQMDGQTATVYASAAERGDEIDIERARHALERAKERLEHVTRQEGEAVPMDLDRAKLALMRAMLRIRMVQDASESQMR